MKKGKAAKGFRLKVMKVMRLALSSIRIPITKTCNKLEYVPHEYREELLQEAFAQRSVVRVHWWR